MTEEKYKELFYSLGKNFYDWNQSGQLKFIFGTEGKNIEKEILRLAELIEYVKDKKEALSG